MGVRIRPLNSIELNEKNNEVFKKVGKQMVREHHFEGQGVQGKEYIYDHVFGPKNTTKQVYERLAKPLVEKAIEGFNGTIFAYGQTSSGKTHTLMGSDSDPGITIQACREVFELISGISNTEFLVRISYIEIYNEEIKDLLEPVKKNGQKQLRIKDDKKKGPVVDNLKEQIVTDPEQAMSFIAKGEGNRSYGSTSMNEQSSRSHVLFKMVIESRVLDSTTRTRSTSEPVFTTGWSKERPPVTEAALNLVDLAGSERQKKTNASGQRLKEGNAINQSLLTLGTVISKLSEGARGAHIPYRDSKLTRLLQTSLGGNAKTGMVAAISPAERNRDETTSTLRYASRAKQIVNHAKKNEIDDEESMLAKYKNEIEDLKKELEESRNASTVDQAALAEANDIKAQLEQMNKLVLVSTQIAAAERKMGNRSVAREIEKDIADVSIGRRRAQSIYDKHKNMIETLPDNVQKKLARQRSSIKMLVSSELTEDLNKISEEDEVAVNEDDEEEDLVDNTKLKEAEDELNAMQARLVELQQENQELIMSKQDLQKDISSLNNKVTKHSNDLKMSHRDLEKYKKASTDLSTKLENSQAKQKEAEAKINTLEADNKHITTSFDNTKYELSKFEKIVADKDEWIKKLEKQSQEEHEKMIKDSEENLKAHQSALSEERTSLDNEKKEKRAIEMKLDETLRLINNLNLEVSSLKKDKHNNEETISSMQKEKIEARESSEASYKRLHEELDSAQAKVTSLSSELTRTSRDLRNTSSELEQTKSDKANLTSELSSTKEELHNLTNDNEESSRSMSRQIEDLKREQAESKANSEHDISTKNNEIDSLKMEVASLNTLLEEEKSQMEKQKKRAQDALASLDSERESKVKELDKVCSELSVAKLEATSSSEALSNFKAVAARESARQTADLEALNSENEEEKRRSSTLASEKSRMSVELDGLNRKVDRLTADLEMATTSSNARSEECDELQREVRSYKRKLELSEEKSNESIRRAEIAEDKLSTTEAAKETIAQELTEALRLHGDNQKEILNLKKTLSTLKDELNESDANMSVLRQKIKDGEEIVLSKSKLASEKDARISELLSQIAKLKEFEEASDFMQNKVKKVELELDRCLAEISESKKSQLDAEGKLVEVTLKAQRHEDHAEQLQGDIQSSKQEIKTLRETLSATRAANMAKDDAVDAANRKAEVALSGKAIIEKELEELRESILSLSKAKRFAESEASSTRREHDVVQIELEDVRNRLKRTEASLIEARNDAAVGDEVAVLRNQLSKMRAAMMGGTEAFEGEMFDEEGNLIETGGSPRKGRLNETALMEAKREREAFELVISKLRNELANEADSRRELIADLSSARKEAAVAVSVQGDLDAANHTIRKLEEDIANMEVEVARARRNELNAVAVSTEAERNVGRVNDDSVILSSELKEAHDAVTRERARADRYARDLAEAEKRAAELQASKSRAEAVMETAAQESDVKTRALNALRQGEEETLNKLSDLQASYEDLKKQYVATFDNLKNERLEKSAAQNEVARWKEVADLAEKELKKEDHEVVELDDRVRMLTKDLEIAAKYKEKQAKVIESLQEEIANVRNKYSETGSLKAGSALAMLRKELETTVQDWGDAERKRRDREDRLVELKTGLASEQEKNSLLITQLKLVEDQLSMAKEELAVYRQLDVYEQSIGGTRGGRREYRLGTPSKKRDADSSDFASPLSLVGGNVSQIDYMLTEPKSPENTIEELNVADKEGKPAAKKGKTSKGAERGSFDSDEDDLDEEFTPGQLAQAKEYLLNRRRGRRGGY